MHGRFGAIRRSTLAVVVMASALGTTSMPASAAPLNDIAAISAGQHHACARLANRRARCWGFNGSGQLGDGTKDNGGSSGAVLNRFGTGPLRGVAQVSAGGDHTCATLTTGQARCWGQNGSGQLGDGTTDERQLPVTVLDATGAGPLRDVVAVAAGGSHTCALLSSGRVRCWGANTDGQLGIGVTSASEPPRLVKDIDGTGPLTRVVELDAGISHTCARLASRQVRCWGRDANGELGDAGGEADSALPVVVRAPSGSGALDDVTHVDLGEYHSCASLANGQIRCWGYNFNGELGDGTIDNRYRPVRVKSPSGSGVLRHVVDVDAGGSHTCARLETRRARCWGDADDGQLGDGDPTDYRTLPVTVRSASGRPLGGLRQLGVGFAFTCARFTSGVARCWGDGGSGQLGDSGFADSDVPVMVDD